MQIIKFYFPSMILHSPLCAICFQVCSKDREHFCMSNLIFLLSLLLLYDFVTLSFFHFSLSLSIILLSPSHLPRKYIILLTQRDRVYVLYAYFAMLHLSVLFLRYDIMKFHDVKERKCHPQSISKVCSSLYAQETTSSREFCQFT